MARYEERAQVARIQQSTAPVSAIYRAVLDELAAIDGIDTAGRWVTSSEAGDIRGVSAKTIRKWCADGRFSSARKTSGERGDWRIPTHEVYEEQRRTEVVSTPRLWRRDE